MKWLYENGNVTSIQNERQLPSNKRGEPNFIEFDIVLDEVTYNRYIATYEPELRVKKNKGMPPPGWK